MGRDNTKETEKSYFHCDSQPEKAIKIYLYYFWKEMVISSCYRTVPSVVWEIFSEFLIFISKI